MVWAVLLVLGTTNAVNLTDGLDGLAGGSGALAFFAFVFIDFWAFRNPGTYDIPHALDLAVVAIAMAGACVGFLWWNAAPARIFMGDTGSLAIGAGLAGLALLSNTSLLLPIIGGLFVMETVSVILQVGSFQLTGRRVFRMAPIHHHFELMGWPETTVIVRFWILAGLGHRAGRGLLLRRLPLDRGHRMTVPAPGDASLDAPLVVGLGRTGAAVVAALRQRGHDPVVVEDRPDDALRALAAGLRTRLVEQPTPDELGHGGGRCHRRPPQSRRSRPPPGVRGGGGARDSR